MAKKKPNALETLLQVLAATLIQALPELAGKGIDAIFHKNKAKIKDAAVPVKPSTAVLDKSTPMGLEQPSQTDTEKTQAQKNCEAQHSGQAGYCDSAGTWHPSN